ncbi:hypothetical protein KUG88_28440 [Rhodococcus rhodochrous]|uniref:hypothetical protein n=1 Tax=Rhodococcus rhodochrous TaxID=1829 RepID=UPI001E5F4A96|nr:hypothetical protein [Rhodococcus rhodochrous]MCB8914032.1 hypothetical protein [Rhodococcus rhodochrous]
MRLAKLALVPLVMLIAACGNGAETADTTADSCTSFFQNQTTLVREVTAGMGGSTRAEWDTRVSAIVMAIETAGRNSTNRDVKKRVTAVAATVPADALDLAVSRSAAEQFNTASVAAARACNAAGVEGTIAEFPAVP